MKLGIHSKPRFLQEGCYGPCPFLTTSHLFCFFECRILSSVEISNCSFILTLILWVKKLTFFVCFNHYHVSHPLLMLESVFIYLSIKYLKCVLVSLYVYFEKLYGIIIMRVFQYIRTFFLRGRSNRDSDLKGRQEAKRQTAATSISSVLPCYS